MKKQYVFFLLLGILYFSVGCRFLTSKKAKVGQGQLDSLYLLPQDESESNSQTKQRLSVTVWQLDSLYLIPQGEPISNSMREKLLNTTVWLTDSIVIVNGKYMSHFTRQSKKGTHYYWGDKGLSNFYIDQFGKRGVDITDRLSYLELEQPPIYADFSFREYSDVGNNIICSDEYLCLPYKKDAVLWYKKVIRNGDDVDIVELELAEPVEWDETILPKDEETEIDILIPTGYSGHTLADFEPMYAQQWYDFYKDQDNGKFYLKPASIHLEMGYSECTGDSIACVTSDSRSILLMHGISVSNTEVDTIPLKSNTVCAGERMEFEFNNRKYMLHGEGVQNGILHEHDIWQHVVNYKLYLSEQGRRTAPQLLVAIPRFNDRQVEIIWAGDLDADGKPDFIFDVSDFYESQSLVFFLSSKADSGKLVKCVGRSDYFFGC